MMQGLRELWGKIQYNIKRVMDSDPAAHKCMDGYMDISAYYSFVLAFLCPPSI